MISLLLKLLIAHSIGDFVLQPNKWVDHKKKYKHKSEYLYLHVLIHAIVLLVAIGFDWDYWPIVLMITVSHFVIDLVKVNIENAKNNRRLFAFDQMAHIIIIGVVVHVYEPYQIDLNLIYSNDFLLLLLALIFITSISAVIMKLIMSQWTIADDTTDSLDDAGKYIGILERLFVFGFIVLNQWQAIGLLIAAKSVFRFGDLSKAKDRKLTEYILIGTLLSFGLAMTIGLAYNYALQHW